MDNAMTLPDSSILLALDFGGTKLTAALVAAGINQGRGLPVRGWLAHAEAASPADCTCQSDLRIMRELVGKLLAVAEGPLAAIGVSFGGPVAKGRRVVRLSYHVPGWEEVALCDRLEVELGAPAFMDNDGNTAALGEYRYGAGQGTNSLLYITCLLYTSDAADDN